MRSKEKIQELEEKIREMEKRLKALEGKTEAGQTKKAAFAGADPDVPDSVLEMCDRAAVEWYRAAGVKKQENSDLWQFWVCNLAAWMYDNRGNADPNAAVPIYIVTSVHQLRKGGGG